MTQLPSSFQAILDRIAQAAGRVGRTPESVQLLGVSKGQPIEKILELAQLGLRDFGENYVQEWRQKKQKIEQLNPGLAANLRWHFIGHLQSNKTELIAGQVEILHSVDSLKLAKKLSVLAQRGGFQQRALLEVNLAEEPDKSGLRPADLPRILADFVTLPGLRWEGLMAIPPAGESAEAARPYFKRLKSLLDESNRSGFLNNPMVHLSMGMSQDFEIAIEEGATLVRVGTAIFGARA